MRPLKAKVAIAGVGNCASVFVQGLVFYADGSTEGLWHPKVGGLTPKDIEVVAAFDVDSRKVGLDLSEAIFAAPNVARAYHAVGRAGVRVSPGLLAGKAAPSLSNARIRKSRRAAVSSALAKSGANILLNLVSSGSDSSTEEYSLAALEAGCSFVNCAPTTLQAKPGLAARFKSEGCALVGDDLMSQLGGTAFHKGLLSLMVSRGIKVGKSYQLDVGGGSETLNTVEETVKGAKRKIKTASVASEVPYEFETIAGTTDYVDYMGNERTSYFWSEGFGFMSSPLTFDVYLRTSDGANAGNTLFDVLRATAKAVGAHELDKVDLISQYGFKAPRKPAQFQEASDKFVSAFVG